MDTAARETRLRKDYEALRELAEHSPIFSFEAEGEPPERYVVTFRGKSLSKPSLSGDVQTTDEQQCEIRLGYAYPERPPYLHWRSPIFHPNVFSSGSLQVEDCGLDWNAETGLDTLCERLWDLARFDYVNLEDTSNPLAEEWAEKQTKFVLPADPRPLREQVDPRAENLIRYGRQDELRSEANEQILVISDQPASRQPESPPADAKAPAASREDVFYIGEETPLPPQREERHDNDDDILYIGWD